MAGNVAGTPRRAIRIPHIAPLIRVAAIGLALILGCWGFSAMDARLGQPPALAGDAMKAVRLIVGNFPSELENETLPWTLTIARWALPLLTFWTTLALVWAQIRNPLRLALMRTRGEHLIITGDAGLARQLASAELERGRRVLLWPQERGADWVDEAMEFGAASLPARDDATEVEQLGLDKARGVLLVAPDDSGNTALVARVMAEAARGRPPGDPLNIVARIDNLDLRRGVEARFDRADRSAARVRFASLPDIAARELFTDRPLDAFRRRDGSDRRIFVLGYSPVIERYVLRLLSGAHFRDGVKPQIIIVDPRGAELGASFRADHPGAEASSLVFESGGIDKASHGSRAIADLTQRHGRPISIIVDCGDDARSLALALAIDGYYAGEGSVSPPIHVHLQSRADERLGISIRAFGCFDHLIDPEMLLQERHDVLARSIHDFYLEGRLDEGGRIGSHASMREWEDLAESFRDDNRLVADCYQLKLRDIGARLVRGNGQALRFDEAELEELARAEHYRWMGAKRASGWVHGAVRDDQARIHPDITEYDALSEAIKDLDREQIRVMTRLLGNAGLRALRVLKVAVQPGGGAGLAAGVEAVLPLLATHYPDRVMLLTGLLDDPSSRAALLAAAREGQRVRPLLAGNVQALADGLPTGERDAIADLVRGADSIVALADETDTLDAWREDADLLLATGPVTGSPCPVIGVSDSGAIVSAPWRR